MQPISFYGGDKNVIPYPAKQEDFAGKIYDTSTRYVVVDAYERSQPQWAWSYVSSRHYLTLEKVFYQNNQPVVGIFKVDGGKLLAELQGPVNNTGG